jgi:hypothetical protein
VALLVIPEALLLTVFESNPALPAETRADNPPTALPAAAAAAEPAPVPPPDPLLLLDMYCFEYADASVPSRSDTCFE